jgi:hypothetical protein
VKFQTCGTTYRPEILRMPTSANLTDSIRDTMRVAAVAMLTAGNTWDLPRSGHPDVGGQQPPVLTPGLGH